MRATFEKSMSFTEPFHGAVWLGISREGSPPRVRLVVSIADHWDTDLFITPRDAAALGDALGGSNPRVIEGKTVDGDLAVLVAERDRVAITVVSERLSDVLTLGRDVEKIREVLTAAAADSS